MKLVDVKQKELRYELAHWYFVIMGCPLPCHHAVRKPLLHAGKKPRPSS